MADKVSFSKENQGLSDIYSHHSITATALREYYFPDGGKNGYHARFFGEPIEFVKKELAARVEELEMSSSFSLLSALEASFRKDYLRRCYERPRDALSRAFRDIYRERAERATLEDDILRTWREHCIDREDKQAITALIDAMKYRHWIAHGRYWLPKNWGRSRYDYGTIYSLAKRILDNLTLLK